MTAPTSAREAAFQIHGVDTTGKVVNLMEALKRSLEGEAAAKKKLATRKKEDRLALFSGLRLIVGRQGADAGLQRRLQADRATMLLEQVRERLDSEVLQRLSALARQQINGLQHLGFEGDPLVDHRRAIRLATCAPLLSPARYPIINGVGLGAVPDRCNRQGRDP